MIVPIVFVFFVLVYVGIATVVTTAILFDRRPLKAQAQAQVKLPTVSVVVAVRNEAKQISECLTAILGQDYPQDLIDILVVDDDSNDSTAEIIEQFSNHNSRVNLLHASVHSGLLTAKSRPLDVGIRHADAEFIATTDADCRPPKTWLSSLVNEALSTEAKMICGCTVVTGNRLSQKLQRLDWLNLKSVAAGLDIIGKPLTAMGNNMLFERDLYIQAGGYERMGDSVTEDYLFYRTVTTAKKENAMISIDPGAKNLTVGEDRFADLLNQKKRWLAGGTTAPPFAWTLFIVYFATHFSLIAAFAVSISLGWSLLGIKMLGDAAMVFALSRKLDVKVPWWLFPGFQLYQILCATLLPVSLITSRRVDWKDRRIALSAQDLES